MVNSPAAPSKRSPASPASASKRSPSAPSSKRSPASPAKRSPSNSSSRPILFPTQRSGVSTAFDDKKVLKDTHSLVSAGTVVNPDATAKEILTVAPTYKSPAAVIQNSIRATSPPASTSSKKDNEPSTSVSIPTSARTTTTQKTTNFTPSGSEPSTSSPGKHASPGQPAQGTVPAAQNGAGKGLAQPSKFKSLIEPVMMTTKTGSWIDLVLGMITTGIFLYGWIFMLTKAQCYRNKEAKQLFEWATVLGAVGGVMVIIYSIFEKALFARRGLAGCCFFTVLGPVFCINVVGAVMSLYCVCRCDTNENPFKAGGSDLVIFLVEVGGSMCLVTVLLVASLSSRP